MANQGDSLPSLRLDASGWSDGPPDIQDAPALHEGVLMRRVLAYAIDVAAIAVLSTAAWVAFGILSVMSFGLLAPIGIISISLIPLSYHTFFLGRYGATPGMRFFDLQMWTQTGQRPEYIQAFFATALFYVSVGLTAFLILIIALFNDHRRTLHDLLAGTIVLRRAEPARDGT